MLRFTNHYPSTTWVTIIWYSPDCPDGSQWEKEGWWGMAPGESKVVFGSDLDEINRYYYFHAEADDGAFWAGSVVEPVTDAAFDWCLDTSSTAARDVGFRELDIGGNDDYTVTLIP